MRNQIVFPGEVVESFRNEAGENLRGKWRRDGLGFFDGERRRFFAGGEIVLPEAWRVTLDEALLAALREWLTPENVRVVY